MTSKHSLFSSLGRRLGGLFKKESAPDAGPRALSDRGLLAFSHTGDVIRAERLLRQQGFDRADEILRKADERIGPSKPDLIHRKAGVRAGPQIPFRVWMICGLAVPTLLNCFDSRE